MLAYGLYAAGSTATIPSNAGSIFGSSATGAAYGVYGSTSSANIIVTSNANDIHGSTNSGSSRSAGLYATNSSVTISANTGSIYASNASGTTYAGGPRARFAGCPATEAPLVFSTVSGSK